MCYHNFYDGFGVIGPYFDNLICEKCGLEIEMDLPNPIEEIIANTYKVLGRIHKNNGDYIHYNTPPYVRKKELQ
jgi:hypothetical protein